MEQRQEEAVKRFFAWWWENGDHLRQEGLTADGIADRFVQTTDERALSKQRIVSIIQVLIGGRVNVETFE